MLKKNRATIFLAAVVMFAPMLLATPANAGSRYNNREVNQRRAVYQRPVYQRVVRLRNGAYRLPNGQVIPGNRLVRLRNQGYWRLPNGDIVLPSQEIVPVRSIVRLRDGSVRLPNGVLVRL
ncbi:conserved hypothetical protein [Trichormus variabilis ATCC 29413]|uniref:Uncharacterized protein n=3 Tax=Nostocaceae TaxID=1162 RepID=Q3M966_TRIV2|nr:MULTISPECIES: hypothetical protein [Nostocaceae]ABA22470.1 conserved hypothetical protein [Trichormus variabilis ATCC 29413]MBC1215965.1 hypothetical protein [Trichormus variabilis ARAD]MBC1258517.1 hypothetical protein [Trichormus variabilis V5]MBC1270383.1 hypothetical protein [Trichormus variabilis FSR]MBC1304440.1 hypothetical protein [Trichormus variabilis N2B]